MNRSVPLNGLTLSEFFLRLNRLEHDPEKWKPVFRKDHAQTKS
jgi:hypothetical protein